MLDNLRIATPCSASWNDMGQTENDAVRFCGQCSKNVYDISNMSKAEAELLIQRGAAAGALPCMKLYVRQDGTIITDDCPVGLRRIRDFWRKVQSLAAAVAALLLVVLPAMAQNKDVKASKSVTKDSEVYMKMGRVRVDPPVMLGSPPAIDWRVEAMKKSSVKSLADRIEALQKPGNLSAAQSIKVFRLQLEMAQEAEKNNVPYFAMEEMAAVQNSLEKLTDKNTQSERKILLKDVLKARIINAKKLKISDSALSEQLNKLTSGKF